MRLINLLSEYFQQITKNVIYMFFSQLLSKPVTVQIHFNVLSIENLNLLQNYHGIELYRTVPIVENINQLRVLIYENLNHEELQALIVVITKSFNIDCNRKRGDLEKSHAML